MSATLVSVPSGRLPPSNPRRGRPAVPTGCAIAHAPDHATGARGNLMTEQVRQLADLGVVEPRAHRVVGEATVYDRIARILTTRGWVRGVERSRRGLSLRAAIAEAVAGGDGHAAVQGPTLARAARVGAHLRDLLSIRNLDAWSDHPARTFDEILALLRAAALAFETD
jgi:hypothetical protein